MGTRWVTIKVKEEDKILIENECKEEFIRDRKLNFSKKEISNRFIIRRMIDYYLK